MPNIQNKTENLSQLPSSYLSNYLNIGLQLDFKSAYVYIFERIFQFLPCSTASVATPTGQHERVQKSQKWGKAEDRHQEGHSMLC